MDTAVLIDLVVLVLSILAAALSWRSTASYLCIAIAIITLIRLLPGGPF